MTASVSSAVGVQDKCHARTLYDPVRLFTAEESVKPPLLSEGRGIAALANGKDDGQ